MVRRESIEVPFLILPTQIAVTRKDMKRQDIIQNLIYGILLSAFLLFYFILSMNSRMVADDFYFLKNFQDHGWWQSVSVSWHSWITRWASVFWLNVIFSLFTLTGNFLFFHIITLLMLCFALYRWSTSTVDFFLAERRSKFPGIAAVADLPRHSRFTICLFVSFFLLTASIGETFFWITSSSMYLWGFIAFCFLTAEVFKGRRNLNSFIIILLTAAFIGGAAEAIALAALLLLSVIIVYRLVRKKTDLHSLVALSVLTVSLIVSYAGEGRALRQSALPQNSVIDALLLTVKSMARIEIYFIREKLIWLILFFISWMGFAENITLPATIKWKSVFGMLSGFILLCFIFVFPACYLLGEIPPLRAWILAGFLNCCILVIGGILTGAWLRNRKILRVISSLSVLLLVFMIVRISIQQKQITGNYSRAVDARLQFLTKLVDPEDTTTIILDPLPDSGVLMSSEISTVPSDFRNQHLKNFLGIRADVRVR